MAIENKGRKLQRISALLLTGQVFIVACLHSVQASQSESSAMNQPTQSSAPPQAGGQQRELIPLNESEIRDALVGQRLSVDRGTDWEPNQRYRPFQEDFFSDGTWKTVRPAVALLLTTGVWRIHNGEICTRETSANARKEVCRQVWRDKSTGWIAMTDARETELPVRLLSSSPLK